MHYIVKIKDFKYDIPISKYAIERMYISLYEKHHSFIWDVSYTKYLAHSFGSIPDMIPIINTISKRISFHIISYEIRTVLQL